MMPEMEKRIRERKVPWDEVRERRVMERVLSARAAGQHQNPPRKPLLRLAALSTAAFFAAAVLGWMLSTDDGVDGAGKPSSSGSGAAVAGADDGLSVLQLADVGEARLSAGAVVRITEQRTDATTVSQTRGRVFYRIAKQRHHEVVIRAAGIRVRVVGTRFAVDIEDSGVSVSVTEGVVSVEDGEQAVTLRAGERISVKPKERSLGDEVRDVGDQGASTSDGSENLAPLSTDGKADGGAAETAKREAQREERDTPAPLRISLDKVDRLRKEGAFRRAARELRRIIDAHPEYKDVTTLWFTLGNVERARGRHLAAAAAYRKCHRISPKGPLAEDALAESAASYFKAGARDKAESATRRYLEKYPEGSHKSRLKDLMAVKKEDDTAR